MECMTCLFASAHRALSFAGEQDSGYLIQGFGEPHTGGSLFASVTYVFRQMCYLCPESIPNARTSCPTTSRDIQSDT